MILHTSYFLILSIFIDAPGIDNKNLMKISFRVIIAGQGIWFYRSFIFNTIRDAKGQHLLYSKEKFIKVPISIYYIDFVIQISVWLGVLILIFLKYGDRLL